MAAEVEFLRASFVKTLQLPYADQGIHAGFPSPAQDYIGSGIDFNRDIVRHPEATYYARVVGDSMLDAGIHPGDLLVIDRAIDPRDGCIAVCFLDGEFVIKRLDLKHKAQGRITLHACNPAYAPIVVTPDRRFELWGVVAYVIHSTLGKSS